MERGGEGFFGEGRKMSERVEKLDVKCSGEEEGRSWGGGQGGGDELLDQNKTSLGKEEEEGEIKPRFYLFNEI